MLPQPDSAPFISPIFWDRSAVPFISRSKGEIVIVSIFISADTSLSSSGSGYPHSGSGLFLKTAVRPTFIVREVFISLCISKLNVSRFYLHFFSSSGVRNSRRIELFVSLNSRMSPFLILPPSFAIIAVSIVLTVFSVISHTVLD